MMELGSRQNMTGMETERARGKCIANALVCQLCWIFLFDPEGSLSATKFRQSHTVLTLVHQKRLNSDLAGDPLW